MPIGISLHVYNVPAKTNYSTKYFAVDYDVESEFLTELVQEPIPVATCFCVTNNLLITQIYESEFMITGVTECADFATRSAISFIKYTYPGTEFIVQWPEVEFTVPLEDGAEFEVPELQP